MHVLARPLAVLALALAFQSPLAAPLAAQSSRAADTVRAEPAVRGRDLLLLAAGAGASIALMARDENIARDFLHESQGEDRYDGIASAAALVNEKSLFAAGVLAYGIGRLTKARAFTDVAWHATEAVIITSTASTIVRGALGRTRPFVSREETGEYDAYDYHPGKGFGQLAYRAFPSIHAATSFAAASVLSAEARRRAPAAGWVVTPVAYGLATLPGLGRMYKDKHWASDVLMGAVLGEVVGRAVVRWHHTRPGNRLDRAMLGVTATVDPAGRPALAWSRSF